MNLLVIGLGSAGQRHARVMRHLYPKSNIYVYRGNHFTGLINKDLQSIDPKVDPIIHYNLIEVKDLEKLNINIDLTVIATPENSHFFYTEKVWDSSCRILVEKPLSNSITESHILTKKALMENKIFFTGYQHNFNPLFEKIISIYNSYSNWSLLSCEFHESLHEMNIFRDMNKHYLSNSNESNALLALSHEIEFVFRLLRGNWIEIKSQLFSSGTLGEVLDTAKVAGIYGGSVSQIQVSISLCYGNIPKSRKGSLVGKDAKLYWDLSDKSLTFNGETSYFNYEPDDLISAEIEYLINVKELDLDLRDALNRAVRIVELNG